MHTTSVSRTHSATRIRIIPEKKSKYLFDTVSLSNFALAGQVDLLNSRYGKRLLVTEEVLNEITDGVIAGFAALREIEHALDQKVFTLVHLNERDLYRQSLRTLAPGEASCIAHAKSIQAIVVTDDRVARNCCSEQGIKTTGTLGILKACCLDQSLTPDAADQILTDMIQAGYYSPVQRVSDLL